MTYTKHGHHIPGTKKPFQWPHAIRNCGGPGICRECSSETYFARPEPTEPEEPKKE